MSYLETTNTDGYDTAPAELAERITQLTEQLELKGHEVKKLETNMEEVTGAKLSVKELVMHLGVAAFISICIYILFWPFCSVLLMCLTVLLVRQLKHLMLSCNTCISRLVPP